MCFIYMHLVNCANECFHQKSVLDGHQWISLSVKPDALNNNKETTGNVRSVFVSHTAVLTVCSFQKCNTGFFLLISWISLNFNWNRENK